MFIGGDEFNAGPRRCEDHDVAQSWRARAEVREWDRKNPLTKVVERVRAWLAAVMQKGE